MIKGTFSQKETFQLCNFARQLLKAVLVAALGPPHPIQALALGPISACGASEGLT